MPSALAMTTRLLAGLSDIAPDYDALICDVWGVVHEGHRAHDVACDALRRFRQTRGPVILLTNAPRVPSAVEEQFAGLAVPDDCYDVIISSGGAARAVAVELALAGAKKIAIVNRSRARGAALVGVLREQTSAAAEFVEWTGDYVVPATADVVINGTSIGLYDGAARVPVALESLRPGLVAADVVFSPPDTAFLREAKARGCTCIDGLGMLVNQGVIGVRHWTGVSPDVPAMRRALAAALGVSIA